MTIAELFVNLGVKGAEKSVAAVDGVAKGMGEVKSSGLAAKAAIIGVIYGLEQLMSASAAKGTSLLNFESLTGLSAKGLQQWQFAARQAGESAEEITGSIKGVQDAMARLNMGMGAPMGMGLVSSIVGLDERRLSDTSYVLGKLQEFAKQSASFSAEGNLALRSFGLSDATISAMRRNAFTPDMLGKSPLYSDREITQLNKVDVAWKNLGQQIEMAMGHLTSKHGLQLVHEISQITTQVLKLTDALVTLSEKMEVFKVMAVITNGLTMALRLLNGETADQVMKDNKVKGRRFGEGTWWMNAIESMENSFLQMQDHAHGVPRALPPSNNNNNTTINQQLHFQHDGRDHHKNSESHKKAAQAAYRQSFAQAQVV